MPAANLDNVPKCLEILDVLSKIAPEGDGVVQIDSLRLLFSALVPSLHAADIKTLLDSLSNGAEKIGVCVLIDWLFGADRRLRWESVLLSESEQKLLEGFRCLEGNLQCKALATVTRLRVMQEGVDLFAKNKLMTSPSGRKGRNYRRSPVEKGGYETFRTCVQPRSSFTQMEREAVHELIRICSGGEKNTLDMNDFKLLHQGIGETLNPKGPSTWESTGAIFSAESLTEFKKVDLDGTGHLVDSEIAIWMQDIADTTHGYYHQFEKFTNSVKLRLEAIVEVDKYSKTNEMMSTLARYSKAYKTVRATKGYEGIKSWPEKDVKLRQPEKITDFDDLIVQAKTLLPKLDSLALEICARVGVPYWSMGPLKGKDRAQEKIKQDYNDDVRRLLDVARMSLVMEDINMMSKTIKFLEERKDYKIRRVKSAFEAVNIWNGTTGGYRDVKLNIEHVESGHLFEVQLHMLSFYSIKRENGHELYCWSRKFKNLEVILSPNDVLDKLRPDMLSEMATVARLKLEFAVGEHGDNSTHAMTWRLTLAKIADILSDNKTVKTCVNTLFEQAEKRSIPAATDADYAEIYLTSGSAEVFDKDKSLELCLRAKTLVEGAENKDITTDEAQFMFRVEVAIGSCYTSAGKYEDALATFKRAEELWTKLQLPTKHPKRQSLSRKVGVVYKLLDRIDEAIKEFKSAAELSDHSTQCGRIKMELGECYKRKEDWSNAIECLDVALTTKKKELGNEHMAVGNALVEIGDTKLKMGDTEGGLQSVNEALRIFERCRAEAGDLDLASYKFQKLMSAIDWCNDQRTSGEKNAERTELHRTSLFMSMQHTVMAQEVIAKQQCNDMKASITPFNLSKGAAPSKNICHKAPEGTRHFDVPCYGTIPGAAHAIFTEEMKQLANNMGFKFPRYCLDKFVQGKMSKVKDAIEEWRLRPHFSDHHKACLDKLWAFADDFSKLKATDMLSPTTWKEWVEKYVKQGWEDRLHFADVLVNFGFDNEVSKHMRAQQFEEVSKSGAIEKVSLEQHAVRWLSKALAGYKPEGCYTDVVNLVFAMMGKGAYGDASRMTESQIVAILGEFSAQIASGTVHAQGAQKSSGGDAVAKYWIPTHLVHDAEMDDMLVWVLLHYLHMKLGTKLTVRIQLPTSDKINDLAEKWSSLPDVEVFRDEGSKNEKAIMHTFGLD